MNYILDVILLLLPTLDGLGTTIKIKTYLTPFSSLTSGLPHLAGIGYANLNLWFYKGITIVFHVRAHAGPKFFNSELCLSAHGCCLPGPLR